MLFGEGNAALAPDAPRIIEWNPHRTELEGVDCFQLIAEMRRSGRAQLLPPSLHPTDPPTLSVQAWNVEASPWGAFRAVFTRVSCRSGVRARGLTTAMVASTEDAARGFVSRFGFPARTGSIQFAVHYDGIDLAVDDTLCIKGVNPTALGLDDVQYTGTMNAAHTPKGPRLVQVETEHEAVGVHRVKARIERFDPAAWGDQRLSPYDVVTATLARDRRIVLPPIRFVCLMDISAFEGTERVSAAT